MRIFCHSFLFVIVNFGLLVWRWQQFREVTLTSIFSDEFFQKLLDILLTNWVIDWLKLWADSSILKKSLVTSLKVNYMSSVYTVAPAKHDIWRSQFGLWADFDAIFWDDTEKMINWQNNYYISSGTGLLSTGHVVFKVCVVLALLLKLLAEARVTEAWRCSLGASYSWVGCTHTNTHR